MSTLPVVSAVSPSPPASKLSPARLSERAARAFSPRACLEGYALFAKGAVVVDRLDRERAVATVRGERSRTVDVGVEAARLRASCTCSPSTLPLAPCRHLWAVLLELDRRDAFASLQATRGRVEVEIIAPAPATPPPPEEAAQRRPKRTAKEAKEAKEAPKRAARAKAPPKPPARRGGRRRS